MEQHRTPPPRNGTQRGRPPLPPQAKRGGGSGAAAGGTGAVARPAVQRSQAARPGDRPAGLRPSGPPLAEAVRRLRRAVRTRRMPEPRLTGLGGGLFCGTLMFVLGCLDRMLFEASPTVYGVLFLPVCLLTALWVRGGDLAAPPVVVPIAYAVGLLPVADGSGGLSGRLMGMATALATQAGWLYGGTLVAGVIATVRKVGLMRRRADKHRPPAP
ncbi:hypothetical protein LXH13_25735 [Streptomyces spinosirectus]|uniref:DUF6542 domain-containing protein n=1 Tax=Streptomyces spinosirectus TaxID=2906474 RepID=UPI001F37F609|nr:DUF6542 domain-containing protein [Streptomyces spinosirectus]UIR20227.1 hypothetical protein LXH13_25735 [Streptomyces spinosirectus]